MSTIGIDLGTTNTVAAVDGEVLGIDLQESVLLPSVVAYPPSGVTLVGVDARRRKTIDEKNTIFSAKRIIGRKWYSADLSEFRKRYPFDLVEKDGEPFFETRVGPVSPVEVASTVLTRVAEHEKVSIRQRAARTVIAVPSLFGQDERQATIRAAVDAGFSDVVIIDEPAATAAAYMSQSDKPSRYAAVYDFGGGTFDMAVVDCAEDPYSVIAHEGDLYLGGDDIDLKLARWASSKVLEITGWNLEEDPSAFSRLVIECERAKIRIGQGKDSAIDLMQVDPAAPDSLMSLEVDEGFYTDILDDCVRRSFGICDEVLRNAGIKVRQIDAVFVAGGTTMIPEIRKGIEKYFAKPVEYPFNPMHIVAIGASLR